MKIVVCGSRTWTDKVLIQQALAPLVRLNPTIIHGACRGADQLAGQVAKSLGLNVLEVPAKWNLHGRGAGFVRNREMIDMGPDLVIGFQRNDSRGTQHTLHLARQHYIPTLRFTWEDNRYEDTIQPL